MTKDEWKSVFLVGIAGSGWFYAIMLTRKEVFDVWQSIAWYEMLISSLLIFFVLTPTVFWMHTRLRDRTQESSPDLPSPAPGESSDRI